jgi:ACT domain-containing protein
MNAIITVVGKDGKGIIAAVSAKCAEVGANIVEISQSVLKDYFAMIMLVDVSELDMPFTDFVDDMKRLGEGRDLDIRTMHEDIFNSMHKI